MLIKLSSNTIINLLQVVEITEVKQESDPLGYEGYYFVIRTTRDGGEFYLDHKTKEAAEAEREKILKYGNTLLVWIANQGSNHLRI